MIGTELLEGQGLGNQLLCYVSARCIAKDLGFDFGVAHGERFKGDFLAADTGGIADADIPSYTVYQEKEDRIFLGNSRHDMTHGCYIAGADPDVRRISDHTLLAGNLQDESYFAAHKDEIKSWLRVKSEYEKTDLTQEDLCIINIRGGEYAGEAALFVERPYYLHAIRYMRRVNPAMRFLVITEDETAAKRVLPEVERIHFDIAGDYVTIKNARYLIACNTSFAVMPVFTSETIRVAIAPKYWARHNVSDGYWASEQNIYSFFQYMDRKGQLFSAQQCRQELEIYKRTSPRYAHLNERPTGMREKAEWLKVRRIHAVFMGKRAVHSLARRMRPDRQAEK